MEYRMAKLTLYHAAPSRSSITLWMLEEIGEPYDIHFLSLSKGDNRTPDYLAVNPMGKVPALKHGDTVITEVAAICAYLADEFPRAKLNVPIGTPRRGVYLKWLFFGPSCFEPAITERMLKREPAFYAAAAVPADYDTREKMGTLTFSDLETTVHSNNLAVMIGRWHLQRANDAPHGRFTVIFRRTKQGWRIVHDHTSSAN